MSELLVLSYVQAIAAIHDVKIQCLSSPINRFYWKSLFPALNLKVSPLPSAYLSPVRRKLEFKQLTKLLGLDYHLLSKQIFRDLWDPSVEESYSAQYPLSSAVANNLLSLLSCNKSYSLVSADNTKPYSSIHLRRGDKVSGPFPESTEIPLSVYADHAYSVLSLLEPLILFGDSSSQLECLQQLLVFKGFTQVYVNPNTKPTHNQGYDQQMFNKMTIRQRISYNNSFLADFGTMVGARYLICSYSSNVGRAAGLIRKHKSTLSVDTALRIVQ